MNKKSNKGSQFVSIFLVLVVCVVIFALLQASTANQRESAKKCDQAAAKIGAMTHDYSLGICEMNIRKTDGSFESIWFDDDEVAEILSQ